MINASLIIKLKGYTCAIPLYRWHNDILVHNWFVKRLANIKNASSRKEILINERILEVLVSDINTILFSKNRVEAAKEIMPVSIGFSYSDKNFEILEKTLREIIEILDTVNFKNTTLYYCYNLTD